MGAFLMADAFITDLVHAPDADKIQALRVKAKELVANRVEPADALAELRGFNSDIDGPCRDPELTTFLRAGRREKITIDDLVKAGDTLSLKAQPFYLEGVVTPHDTNLLVAREKKGKTSFVIAWISAWHFGQASFCDFDIHGECPPVVIIGPDMSESQWGKMLHQYHLADADGKVYPDGPIKLLLHQGHDFCLDQHGQDLIDGIGQLHPGALFVFDSYSRLVSPLGLREESANLADPLIAVQSIMRNRKATDLWLHHSAANRDTGKATSRGSTSLPAAADQIIFLESPSANEDDPRTQLRTKGREMPVQALLERTKPDGVWVCHAAGDELAQQQAIDRKISKVSRGYAKDIFNAMQTLHGKHELGAGYKEIAEVLGLDEKDAPKLYKPMATLTAQALVTELGVNRHSPSEHGGRPGVRFQLPKAVVLALQLPARGSTPITPESLETPDTKGSQPLARVRKIDETLSLVQKPCAATDLSDLADSCSKNAQEVSGVSGITQRADLTPVTPSNPSGNGVSGVNGVFRTSRRAKELSESSAPSTNGHLALSQVELLDP
jgi:hypothetical protein